MQSSLILVMLYVEDIDRSRTFYTERLGMAVVPEFSGPDFVFLRSAGGSPIALQRASALPAYGSSAALTPGGAELGLEIDDVDATYQAWKEAGIAVLGEITDVGVGRAFGAHDPDGHLLRLTQLHPPIKEARAHMGL